MDSNIVVIDTETTGLGASDRIVEIVALTMNPNTGEIIDEFETLVNPERDIGPTSIHGLKPSMVEAAPTFEEIAAALALHLNGAILAAHNLTFDTRMLAGEYYRTSCDFNPGQGHCTLQATRMKLASACEQFGIPLTKTHEAYSDALACAKLLWMIGIDTEKTSPTRITTGSMKHIPRTTKRAKGRRTQRSQMSHVTDIGHLTGLVDTEIVYLDALDHVLDDHILDDTEQLQLGDLSSALGLTNQQRDTLHHQYINLVMKGANRDGIISPAERSMLEALCHSLNIPDLILPEPVEISSHLEIRQNSKICFTGEAIIKGKLLSRPKMEEIAVRNGFVPIDNVTKKCELLVSADPVSLSGKTKQARKYGIPIMDAEEFINSCAIKPNFENK